jgi:polyisoprenoid-binding protein YceI
VHEELANVGFTTAAGRSDRVFGSLVIGEGAVTVVEVTVDMTALRSDADRRDQAIRTQALETRDFPTATFILAEPIVLPAAAGEETAFTIPAGGDLTIHGVTNRVTIDLDAQLEDGRIVVVGSIPILFADYDIAPPQAMVLLSVEDNGIMEFQLVLTRG